MKVTGSVIKEQGVTFGVVLMKRGAFLSPTSREDFLVAAQDWPMFHRLPLVVASQDPHGRFTYWGRQDLTKFLSSINPSRIPWQEYHLN